MLLLSLSFCYANDTHVCVDTITSESCVENSTKLETRLADISARMSACMCILHHGDRTNHLRGETPAEG